MENNNNECCPGCKYKHTPRSEETVKQLRGRINRIIGQLGGIQRMLEENRYCGDILTQIAAVESALQSVGYMILDEHLKTCVVEKVQSGDTEVMSEALELMKKLK